MNFREARRFIKDYALTNNVFVPDRIDIWGNRIWGWRNTQQTIINHPREPQVYRPPVQPIQPTHGSRFNYIPPS